MFRVIYVICEHLHHQYSGVTYSRPRLLCVVLHQDIGLEQRASQGPTSTGDCSISSKLIMLPVVSLHHSDRGFDQIYVCTFTNFKVLYMTSCNDNWRLET